MNNNSTICHLREQKRNVEAHIASLLALPYATRSDVWWQESFARFQQSRDAISKALILEQRPALKRLSKNPWRWNNAHSDKVQVRVGGLSFPKRIDHS